MKNKHEILKEYYGYEEFREGQEYVIDNIIKGNDVIGVMPTGAGKSVCYQVPAIILDGITIVVSPLISLMKDQVSALTQLGIAAAYINSSLTDVQIKKVVDKASNNEYKIIYVSPERLTTKSFINFAKKCRISMITVDEAHCISQWGQDFRPSYSKVPEFIEKLNYRPIISAFTATATSEVRNDIIDKLKLENPVQLVTGFNRKNLRFLVERPKTKLVSLRKFLDDRKDKYGIIYCNTRKGVDELCESLNQRGYNALRYHAGLSTKERQENQNLFLHDEINIIVATNAFGMGIDKSNVGYVVHYNMPMNIESYYQEAGRAGRDGTEACCLLLFQENDVKTVNYLIEHGKDSEHLDAKTIEQLKQHNRERMQHMLDYCKTSDCLRKFILNYFGDSFDDDCANCSNCDTIFETEDITKESVEIIKCIKEVNESFGVNMIVDILRGSKSKNIVEKGLSGLQTYGTLKKISKEKVTLIVNNLISNKYINKSKDKYPILSIGEIGDELQSDEFNIEMKVKSEVISKNRDIYKPKNKFIKIDENLYNELRTLRSNLGKVQNVPAYVIFSDSTLIDICQKHPKDRDELLEVSGIGEFKLNKYGDALLEVLNSIEDKRVITDTLQTDEELDLACIEISDESVTVSEIADKINSKIMQKGYAKISAIQINKILIEKGYLESIEDGFHRSVKIPTKIGKELGISKERRENNGEIYFINKFNRDAQLKVIADIKENLL